jgi:mono/diheme cytochrome c family protein
MSPPSRRSTWGRWLVAGLVLIALLCALVIWANLRGETPIRPGKPPLSTIDSIERGAYLARAGNCLGCHSQQGGRDFAGGLGVVTPFGVVYAANITPDRETGIGAWSADEFWRALHHGRSKSGRVLYPAFPYPSYTHIDRDDSDALYAFLRTAEPVRQANTPHALHFPFDSQAALAVWRALFFKPGTFEADATQSAEWNRGRYLVQGLGHCAACHSSRNALGATSVNAEFAGGLMPDKSWYAPSLADPKQAGVQQWKREDVVQLLKSGVSPHATVMGPMADVVYSSTRYLTDGDAAAMAAFLAAIPVREIALPKFEPASSDVLQRGDKVYRANCAACHGSRGEGVPSIYPALAGNRAVTLAAMNNVVQAIRQGGFSPTTPGNPQPFGMPPFGQVLDNADVSAVATFIRQSWGNQASEVRPVDVLGIR